MVRMLLDVEQISPLQGAVNTCVADAAHAAVCELHHIKTVLNRKVRMHADHRREARMTSAAKLYRQSASPASAPQWPTAVSCIEPASEPSPGLDDAVR